MTDISPVDATEDDDPNSGVPDLGPGEHFTDRLVTTGDDSSASGASPTGVTAFPDGDQPHEGASLNVTEDDQGNVLELIYSNADGVYIRTDGQWQLTDSEQPQPMIDDRVWVDVLPTFLPVFDQMQMTHDQIVDGDVADYHSASV